MHSRAANARDRGWRPENDDKSRITRSKHRERQENESGSSLRCPHEYHCDQREDKHNHEDEDRARRWKSNPQFTVCKTVRDVDEQMSDDDSGRVLADEAHPDRLHQGRWGATPPQRPRCNVRPRNRQTAPARRRNPASWEAC